MLDVPCTLTIAAAHDSHPIVELLIKASGWVIGIGTAVAGIWKYVDQKRDAHAKDLQARKDALEKQLIEEARVDETRRLEIRKPFSVRQQEIYFDLLSTTAVLGNRDLNDPEWEQAFRHFWVLFWGAVPVVADEGVAAALDEFSAALDDPGAGDGIPLRNASMDLGRACRISLGEAWAATFQLSARTTQTRGATRRSRANL